MAIHCTASVIGTLMLILAFHNVIYYADLLICLLENTKGTNKNGNGRSGVLKNGVTTLLFKKLDYCSAAIHSIQLLPVFLDAGTVCMSPYLPRSFETIFIIARIHLHSVSYVERKLRNSVY